MKIARILAALLLVAAAGCATPSGASGEGAEARRESTLENGFYPRAEKDGRNDGTTQERAAVKEETTSPSPGFFSSCASGISAAARWAWNQTSFSKLGFADAILWYIPNRLSDLMDVITIEVGAGEIGADVQLSRYFTFGAGIGQSYMLGWSINNQFGIYQQKGWYFDCFRYRASSILREPVFGDYSGIYTSGKSGLADVSAMFDSKVEDPFAIGVKACCYLNLKFQVHPLELLDLVGGFLFIDCPHDDNPRINWTFGLL